MNKGRSIGFTPFGFLTNQTYLPTNLSESGKLTLGEAAEISFEYINYL